MKLFKGYKEYIGSSADNVTLLRLIYVINFPLVKLFLHYKIQSNTITTLSLISATLSYYFLFNNFYLLLIRLGINEEWATYTLILIFIIVIKGMFGFIKAVYKKNKFMQAQNIEWE